MSAASAARAASRMAGDPAPAPDGRGSGAAGGELQPVSLAQDEGVLEDVLELPHVAGEVVGHQQTEDFGVTPRIVFP